MRTVHSLSLLAICLSLFALSCKDDNPPINPHLIISDYYFQAVLDGDTVTYQENVDDYGQIIGDFYGGTVPNGYEYAPFTCVASADAVANPNPSTLALSGAVSFISVPATAQTTYDNYSGLISTGDMGIGFLSRTSADSATAGGFVSVFDANGVEWTSNGPQTNPVFVVTEYSDQIDNERNPPTRKVIGADFSCTLYDLNGNSKQLTGGRVRGRLIPWQ